MESKIFIGFFVLFFVVLLSVHADGISMNYLNTSLNFLPRVYVFSTMSRPISADVNSTGYGWILVKKSCNSFEELSSYLLPNDLVVLNSSGSTIARLNAISYSQVSDMCNISFLPKKQIQDANSIYLYHSTKGFDFLDLSGLSSGLYLLTLDYYNSNLVKSESKYYLKFDFNKPNISVYSNPNFGDIVMNNHFDDFYYDHFFNNITFKFKDDSGLREYTINLTVYLKNSSGSWREISNEIYSGNSKEFVFNYNMLKGFFKSRNENEDAQNYLYNFTVSVCDVFGNCRVKQVSFNYYLQYLSPYAIHVNHSVTYQMFIVLNSTSSHNIEGYVNYSTLLYYTPYSLNITLTQGSGLKNLSTYNDPEKKLYYFNFSLLPGDYFRIETNLSYNDNYNNHSILENWNIFYDSKYPVVEVLYDASTPTVYATYELYSEVSFENRSSTFIAHPEFLGGDDSFEYDLPVYLWFDSDYLNDSVESFTVPNSGASHFFKGNVVLKSHNLEYLKNHVFNKYFNFTLFYHDVSGKLNSSNYTMYILYLNHSQRLFEFSPYHTSRWYDVYNKTYFVNSSNHYVFNTNTVNLTLNRVIDMAFPVSGIICYKGWLGKYVIYSKILYDASSLTFPLNVTLNFTSLPDSNYDVTCYLHNSYGLPLEYDFNMTIDRTRPMLSLNNISFGLNDGSKKVLTVDYNTNVDGNYSIMYPSGAESANISFEVSDNYLLKSVSAYQDGQEIYYRDLSGASSSGYLQLSNFSTVHLVVEDKAGNVLHYNISFNAPDVNVKLSKVFFTYEGTNYTYSSDLSNIYIPADPLYFVFDITSSNIPLDELESTYLLSNENYPHSYSISGSHLYLTMNLTQPGNFSDNISVRNVYGQSLWKKSINVYKAGNRLVASVTPRVFSEFPNNFTFRFNLPLSGNPLLIYPSLNLVIHLTSLGNGEYILNHDATNSLLTHIFVNLYELKSATLLINATTVYGVPVSTKVSLVHDTMISVPKFSASKVLVKSSWSLMTEVISDPGRNMSISINATPVTLSDGSTFVSPLVCWAEENGNTIDLSDEPEQNIKSSVLLPEQPGYYPIDIYCKDTAGNTRLAHVVFANVTNTPYVFAASIGNSGIGKYVSIMLTSTLPYTCSAGSLSAPLLSNNGFFSNTFSFYQDAYDGTAEIRCNRDDHSFMINLTNYVNRNAFNDYSYDFSPNVTSSNVSDKLNMNFSRMTDVYAFPKGYEELLEHFSNTFNATAIFPKISSNEQIYYKFVPVYGNIVSNVYSFGDTSVNASGVYGKILHPFNVFSSDYLMFEIFSQTKTYPDFVNDLWFKIDGNEIYNVSQHNCSYFVSGLGTIFVCNYTHTTARNFKLYYKNTLLDEVTQPHTPFIKYDLRPGVYKHKDFEFNISIEAGSYFSEPILNVIKSPAGSYPAEEIPLSKYIVYFNKVNGDYLVKMRLNYDFDVASGQQYKFISFVVADPLIYSNIVPTYIDLKKPVLETS